MNLSQSLEWLNSDDWKNFIGPSWVVVMIKFPIGIQDFPLMRKEGFLYIDKTEDIYRMVTSGVAYFLSRPRRFGKSLLVSTLEALFKGKRLLLCFIKLAIEHLKIIMNDMCLHF